MRAFHFPSYVFFFFTRVPGKRIMGGEGDGKSELFLAFWGVGGEKEGVGGWGRK